MLYIPGSSVRMTAKIGEIDATAFILDLEDSVSPTAKVEARGHVADLIARYGVDKDLWVRVNALDSGWLADDLDSVVAAGLTGIVLPKVEAPSTVQTVHSLLRVLELREGMPEGSVALMPSIETAYGLDSVDEIASASPRIHCLSFGAADFSLDIGISWPPKDKLSPTLVQAKSELVLASSRAGIAPPHDGSSADFRDLEKLRMEAEQAKNLGFLGKHAIHPDQLPVIREVFRPSDEDLDEAREILAIFEKGLRDGRGSGQREGQMIDLPVAEMARRTLAAARQPRETRKKAESGAAKFPLKGIRVIDMANLYAGPLIGTTLGDFGADVIKIEHPNGDDMRRWGESKDGVSLWWKTLGRNKRSLKLDLNEEESREVLRRLAAEADVLIESFRPGRIEKWGLGPDELLRLNPRLVIVRISGFGQTGPYSSRPGFGTLAEAFAGFAHITGSPDGPPVLPPFGLADGVCGLTGSIATMMALYWRDAQGGGRGQVVDLSLFEPLFSILGPQISEYAHLGLIQQRRGNSSPRTSPRNAYQTSDERWVVLSGGTQQIANRIFAAIERPELADDERFSAAEARRDNADELDRMIDGWMGAHTQAEVLKRFEEHEAPIAPVYDISQIMEDPQYIARESFVACDDEDMGKVIIPNIAARLSVTPGAIRWTGNNTIGGDSEEILEQYGYRGSRPDGSPE